jgi:hypothetical protein
MIRFAPAAGLFGLGCLGAFALVCFEAWDRLARFCGFTRPPVPARRPRKKKPAGRKVAARR